LLKNNPAMADEIEAQVREKLMHRQTHVETSA
jgi:hypothetical protein